MTHPRNAQPAGADAEKAAFLREALRISASPGMVHLADIGDTVDRIAGKVDCFVLDYKMPAMSGIDLAKRLRNRHVGTPIIYRLSG